MISKESNKLYFMHDFSILSLFNHEGIYGMKDFLWNYDICLSTEMYVGRKKTKINSELEKTLDKTLLFPVISEESILIHKMSEMILLSNLKDNL